MNFEFNRDERQFIKTIHEFMSKFIQENVGDSAEEKRFPWLLKKLLPSLSRISYLSPGLYPKGRSEKEVGNPSQLIAAMEALASHSQSLFLSVEMSTRIFGGILSSWGDSDQKNRWHKPLADGELIGAVALSEETMNIVNEPLRCRAEKSGARLVLNGAKSFVINGPIADRIAVAGMLNERLAFFLVEKGTEGICLGEPQSMLGYDGTAVSTVHFQNCLLHANQVIGPFEDDGILTTIKIWENQVMIGASLGMMNNSFDTALKFAKSHQSGGKPIIAYQEIGFKLAEMLTLYQTAQLFAYRAAWTASNDLKGAESMVLSAKVFCSESAETVSSEALKILSGTGYLSGNLVEQAYRCSKYTQWAGTSNEIARVKIGDDEMGY